MIVERFCFDRIYRINPKAGDNYTKYLYFHGMAVQMAEALAEWSHARIRSELGYGELEPDRIRDMLAQRDRGSRCSFGYPACPNVADRFNSTLSISTSLFLRLPPRLTKRIV